MLDQLAAGVMQPMAKQQCRRNGNMSAMLSSLNGEGETNVSKYVNQCIWYSMANSCSPSCAISMPVWLAWPAMANAAGNAADSACGCGWDQLEASY